MANTGECGPRGPKVRSDCWIGIEFQEQGGLLLDLNSRVAAMYGDSIQEMAKETLTTLGVKNAKVMIEDAGALPFVICARLEAAVRRSGFKVEKPYTPPMIEANKYKTTKDKLRRSRLYLPGNQPKLFINAGLHKADGVILDLEDSVSAGEKDAAALLVRNALCAVDFNGAERMVRINQLPKGLDDLDHVIPHNVHVILIPKCESADHVIQVDEKIQRIKKEHGVQSDVFLMPIMESALGAIKAYEIASASKNVAALAVGLEDYTADIGAQRTLKGDESFWARSQVVNAARAAGVQPIDTVFSDVSDMEGLRQSVIEAKGLGFDGKGCIHPRQIAVIHDAFAPSETEIEKALKIVKAFEEAEAKGLGVVSLGSKMIDPPVVKRAIRTVGLAKAAGKLPQSEEEME